MELLCGLSFHDDVSLALSSFVAGYMQMTQEQVEDWSNSPDQYVADEEEETFSVRVSGELVLDELMAAFPEPAVAAVASAVQRRLQEAAQAKVSQLRQHHYGCFCVPSLFTLNSVVVVMSTSGQMQGSDGTDPGVGRADGCLP